MPVRHLLAIATFCAAAGPLLAAESGYTSIAVKDCPAREGEASSTQRCKGYGGIPVLVQEGDLRFAVSYGKKAAAEPASRQSFAPLQALGERIEWRVDRIRGRSEAFATILRWTFAAAEDGSRPKGEVLVVTRLPPGPVCWVALVDARANPNANELARKVADERARAFRCDAEPAYVGERGPGAPDPQRWD